MTTINEEIQAFNQDVAGWNKRFSNHLRARIRSLSQKGKGDLLRSLYSQTYRRDGEIDRIGYAFDRHGVFWQKGVGRGYVMQGGRIRWGIKARIGRNLHDKRTDFRAVSGEIGRKPVDWFNQPLEKHIEELADIVANHYADRIVNATSMRIR